MHQSTLLVGDVHGKLEEFQDLYDKHDGPVIQLGDVGFGFVHVPVMPSRVKILRGNHDYPELARKHPNYIGDYGTFKLGDKTVFYLSGAFSVDWKWRVLGESWWRDEELSSTELQQAEKLYRQTKPDIVLSHECPGGIVPMVLMEFHLIGQNRDYKDACAYSRTAHSLQRMYDYHQPEYWYFGHYHIDHAWVFKPRSDANNTIFRCLNELSTYEIQD